MAATLDLAREISRESTLSSSTLFVTNPRRWLLDVETARSLHANSDLGEIQVVESQLVSENEVSSAGTLCETLDLLRWVVGEISEVHAVGGGSNILVNLRFTGGEIGRVMSLKGCAAPPCSSANLGIYGTRGAYVNGQLVLDRIAGRPLMTFVTSANDEIQTPLLRCARHFEDHLCDGAALLSDAWDGVKSVAVSQAVQESLNTGIPAKVPSIAPFDSPAAAVVKRSVPKGVSIEG